MQSKQVLIKYGGNAMSEEGLKKEIAKKIKLLQGKNIKVILVHGGGPFINKALESAGISTEFLEGHRYTSAEALHHIEKTLKGEVNSSLVGMLNKEGLRAVGLSGKDGEMVLAEKRWHMIEKNGNASKIDLGQVGNVKSIDCRLINTLLAEGFTPVITCIASDEQGLDYNINADMFAGHMAAALQVDDYIVLTDVDGLFKNFPDPDSLLSSVLIREIPSLYQTVITGGMIPKIASCEIALNNGAKKAVILNGTKPDQIETYFSGNEPVGTKIYKS